MSIVPYRPSDTGRIVYHDPTSQILVVHNNRNNSVELYGSNSISSSDLNQTEYHLFNTPVAFPGHEQHRHPRPTKPPCCPNCGVDLTEVLADDEFSSRFGTSGYFKRNPNGRSSSQNGNVEYAEERFTGTNSDEDHKFSRYIGKGQNLKFGAEQAQFMRHDYFQLLADLPYGSESESLKNRAIRGLDSLQPRICKDTELEQEDSIFNQGYFERFFQKVPPGILGCGAHAQVYKVAHVLKGIQLGIFAVKRINVGDHLHFLEQVLNEVLILYELSVKGANENNLIRYNHVWMEYGDILDSSAYILSPETGLPDQPTKVPYVYILQQYCDGGHLESLVTSNFLTKEHMTMKQKIDEERARRRDKSRKKENSELKQPKKWLADIEIWKFFSDITHGVAYLHSHGILHRDLKPSNCLLDVKYDAETILSDQNSLTEEKFDYTISLLPKVLVSDFGEGKFLNKTHKGPIRSIPRDERRGNTGTIEFTDPKLWVFEDSIQYDGKPRFAHQFSYDSDIYSLGMILCFLCVGKLPFAEEITDHNNPELVRNQIARWHADLTSDQFNDWFDRKNIILKGEVSPVMVDFRVLIFSMIKGQDNACKPSPKICAEFLDSIRWNRFIINHNRRQSEATIVEMGNLSASVSTGEDISTGSTGAAEEALEDAAMGETLDLVSLEKSPLTCYFENLTAFQEERDYTILFIKSVYVLNLVLVDLFTPRTRPPWILALKMGNLISLAGESYTPADFRLVNVKFWALATLATVIYLRIYPNTMEG